jgi:hypothetical protein
MLFSLDPIANRAQDQTESREEIKMPKSYFPPQTLLDALSIPQTIYNRNGGRPMFRVTLAEELKLGSGGDKFRDLITASAGYGLTAGSKIAEKIELQPRGEELVKGNIDAAFEALFSIEIFQKFYEHFGTGGSKSVPSENAAKDFLEKECGIPPRQVSVALANVIKNAQDWQLIQEIAGGEKIVPVELAKSRVRSVSGSYMPVPLSPSDTPSTPPLPKLPDPLPKPSVDITPKLQLNIEIHIAADTPDAKIETIFKNMKKYLLTND